MFYMWPKNNGYRILLLITAAITFWLTYLFSFRSVIVHDYGILIDRSYRIFMGQIPYRDFNLPITPLTYFIQAAVFKIFSPKVFWMKMSLAFMNMALVGMAIALAWKILKVDFKFLALFVMPAALFWSPGIILMRPWYDFDAQFFAFSTLCLLAYSILSNKRWVILFAGVASGLSILSKQNIGAGSFLLGILFLWMQRESIKERFKDTTLFLTGVGLVAALFSSYLLYNQAFFPCLDWIFFRASKRVDANIIKHGLGMVLRPEHNFLKFVFLLYTVSLVFCWENLKENVIERRLKLGIILYSFGVIFFSCLAEQGNDYPQQQIYLSALLAVLFSFYNGQSFKQLFRKKLFMALIGVTLIILFWPVYTNWKIPFKFQVMKWTPDNPRIKGLYFQYSDYRFVNDLVNFEKKIPKDEAIFLWPDPIFFYFATHRIPPTPQSGFVITSWESPQENINQIGDLLEQKNVQWAIIAQETNFDFGFLKFGIKENWKTAIQTGLAMTSRGDMSKLRDYLYKNFEEVPGPVGYWVLKRKVS